MKIMGANPLESFLIIIGIPILVVTMFTVLAYAVKKDRSLKRIFSAELALIVTMLVLKLFIGGLIYGEAPNLMLVLVIAGLMPVIIGTARGGGDA